MRRGVFCLVQITAVIFSLLFFTRSINAQCVPPPSGMVAWWPLDEASGPTANDIATGGVNNSGTWMNSPVPVAGKVAGALSFSGSNSVDVPNHSELNFGTGDFSIDLWIKTTNASGTRTILDKRTSSGSIPTGYVLYMVNGYLGSQIGDGAGYNNSISTGFVANGNWHHIAVTVDRNNTSGWLHYVDGSAVGPIANPTGYQGSLTNTAPFVMARNLLTPSQTFAGTLDEIELFNRILDTSEIRSIWAADSLGKCKDTCHGTGDANNDGIVLAAADLIYLTAFINGCGPAPIPLYSCDLNGDGYVNPADLQLYQNYFIYGIGVFAPYGGYPVLCPCDPIAAPVPDTVTFGGLKHVSEGSACLEVVDDTLRVTRLAGNDESGFSADLMGLYDEWQCSMEDHDPDGSLALGTKLQVTFRGEAGGVPDQHLGTVTETKIGPNEWKLAADLGASTYTVRIFNGESIVFAQSGIPAGYLNNSPKFKPPQIGAEYLNDGSKLKPPFRGYSRRFIRWHVQGATSTCRIWGIAWHDTSGSVTFEEVGLYDLPMTRIEIQSDGLSPEDGPLSTVTVQTNSIPELVVSETSARLAIGHFHNEGLDYLFLHNPLQGARVFVSLEEYNRIMDTLAEYFVHEAGFGQEAVDSALDAIPTMAEMGMLFEMNDTTYLGAPVVSDEFIPYLTQYMVEKGLTTQAVADEINTINTMTVNEGDPDSILAHVVDVLPALDWNPDEQLVIDAFSSVYASSCIYWDKGEGGSRMETARERGRGWGWIVLADAVGAALGGAAGAAAGGPVGAAVAGAACGAACSAVAGDAVNHTNGIVAPRDSLAFGGLENGAAAAASLDRSFGNLIVFNKQLSGQYGMTTKIPGAGGWSAIAEGPEIGGDTLSIGATREVSAYGEIDGVPDQFIGSIKRTKTSENEWELAADLGACTYTVIGCNGGDTVFYREGVPSEGRCGVVKIGHHLFIVRWPWDSAGFIHHRKVPIRTNLGYSKSTYPYRLDVGYGDSTAWTWEAQGIYGIYIDRLSVIGENLTAVYGPLSHVTTLADQMPSFTILDIGVVPSYICGDANRNGTVNALDVTFLINYLYKHGAAPNPIQAGDANGNGTINALDVTYLINFLYKHGPVPKCP